jgi:hypothetical protein
MVTFGQLAGSSIQIQKLATSENQFELFKKLYSLYDKVFILESLIGPKELAEMSVIGLKLLSRATSRNSQSVTGREKVSRARR